jgi:hypothetical protein
MLPNWWKRPGWGQAMVRVQDASFYRQDFDSSIYRYKKRLNRYGNCVKNTHLYLYLTHVTYCNLFIFQMKNSETLYHYNGYKMFTILENYNAYIGSSNLS